MVWWKKSVTLLVLVICLISWVPMNAYAGATGVNNGTSTVSVESRSSSSWLYGVDQSEIYGDAGEIDLSSDDEEDEDPGVFVKLLMMPINALANGMYFLLDKLHVTLDSIIMGRVNGHGVAINSSVFGKHVVALFTFELAQGNIYGIISSLVYTILRSVSYIIIVCAIYAKVVAAGWNGDSARAWQSFKAACSELAVIILLLQLMPYLMDIILYIRDILLHLIFQMLRDGIGLDESSVSGLAGVFKELSSKGLLNALMYLGSVIITVWYMFQYVGLALTFCIYFFCFPFVCVNSLYARNELVEWWKSVIGNALVPIGDVVLLFIPAAFGLLGDSFVISVIQFCVCASLIPARSVLRAAMGIRSNFAMEMAAMGAMGGALQFAGGVMRGFKNTAAGVAGAVSDINMGKMYSQAGASGPGSGSGGDPTGDGLPYPNDLGGGSGGYEIDPEIQSRYANVSNFEQPEFRGLSNERRAELYRQRGLQKLAGAAVGGIGSVVGSVAGAGSGMFLGANTSGQLASSALVGGVQAATAGISYGAGIAHAATMDQPNNTSVSHAVPANSAAPVNENINVQSADAVGDLQPMSSDDASVVMDTPDGQTLETSASVTPVEISNELVNDTVSGISGFSDAGFESYIGGQYDEIMASDAFMTKQERADELQLRASTYTQNHFTDWFSKEYPTVPTAVASQYRNSADNYIKKRYRFDEKTGENTWDILAQNGAQKRHFTFER